MTTPGLTIRTYRGSDEPEVVTLWCAAFPDDPPRNEPKLVIERKLSSQDDLFLVGEFAGRVVATVLGGYDGCRGWVYHLAVLPQYQSRGFGRAMMVEVEARLAGLGCPKINLQIRRVNSEVVKFYEGLGYRVEERVSMGKSLSSNGSIS